MTSANLVEWSSNLSSKLGGDIARNAAHRATWQEIVCQGDDMRVLDAIETSTPALIAFVRAWQDVRRETYEAAKAEDRAEELQWDEDDLTEARAEFPDMFQKGEG